MTRSKWFGRCSLCGIAALLWGAAVLQTDLQASTIPTNNVTLDIGESVKLNLLTTREVGGVVVGDKLFKEFVYSWSNNMPAPENVNVTAIVDNSNNYGIRFQGTFIDLPGDTTASDASISFKVHVQDDLHLISDAHLASAIFLDEDTPGSFGSVDESFLGNSPKITATLEAKKSTFGAGKTQFEDSVVFDNTYQWLSVQKDIIAFAAEAATEPVRMTIIDQTFSQVEIPEPSALSMMLMLGCVAVLGTSRRSLQ